MTGTPNERVEEIRRRIEKGLDVVIAGDTPAQDWDITADVEEWLVALAQAERDCEHWAADYRELQGALRQAEREREDIAKRLAETEVLCNGYFDEMHVWAEKHRAAQAEVERLLGERDDYVQRYYKARDEAVWLKDEWGSSDRQLLHAYQQRVNELNKAEAALARVRAALDGTHFHHKAYEPECSHCQGQRAALEGRG